jgi:uncharacterized protein YjbI with pentapeptide repeats
MAGEQPNWARCDHDGCIGVRLPTTALCLAHAAEGASDAFDAELKRIGTEGTVDARGVVIGAELLRRLLAAAPREGDRRAFTAARFDQASFQGEARFGWTDFHGEARFDGAHFHGKAKFSGSNFEGEARFMRASFHGEAEFSGSDFQSGAEFSWATFQDDAWFNGANLQERAYFIGARFQGKTWFGGASFHDSAWFSGANFEDEPRFGEATFEREVGFDRARFERATQLGPLLARGVILDDVVFGTRAGLEATAATVCARRAQFPAGVHLRLRFASVVLDDANLAAPAILAGAPAPFPRLAQQEQQIVRVWQRLPPEPRAQRWRPRLLSICQADVGGLRLADVDLRACRFVGAHNLDRLRLEGAPLFARTAGWWRARRKTLAEEQHWRAERPGSWRPTGWYPRACQPPASRKTEAPEVLEPARLAALYRDLRKGREDAKDEPGAADFYYGECEMRRHDPGTPMAERLVLWLYWLLSGYALRAWRALAALAVVVVLAGIMLAFWGFPSVAPSFRPAAVDRGGALVYQQQPAGPPPGVGRVPDGIRFSARSATALLRGPDRPLTPLGEWLEIALRLTGPVLLGLAVLSVRGRVRR